MTISSEATTDHASPFRTPSEDATASRPSPETPPLSETRAETGAGRVAAVDVFRGLAIIEVVVHHVSGMALRHVGSDTAASFWLLGVNRTLHFAVPAFLFMSALILTRAALANFEPGAYYKKRLLKSARPYLVWTVLFVLFRVATEQDPPSVLTQPERWFVWLAYGKGYFHLYFLAIALQLYLLLPLLLPAWRRVRSLAGVVVVGVVVQGAVYVLNREFIHFRFPATMLAWYVLPVMLGMYFGATSGAFERLWQRSRSVILGLAAVALAWYVPTAMRAHLQLPVSSASYSAAHWAYTTLMALVLFGVANAMTTRGGRVQRALSGLGRVSLQVYLLHPVLLYAANQWGTPRQPVLLVVTLLAYALASLLLPAVIARALRGTRASDWLFGR